MDNVAGVDRHRNLFVTLAVFVGDPDGIVNRDRRSPLICGSIEGAIFNIIDSSRGNPGIPFRPQNMD